MAVDDFLRALDSIESEIREAPDVVYVEMSLTRGRITGVAGDTIDTNSRYIMLLTSRPIHAHWESLCFDIGGPEFPFVWSPKRSEVYESFPKDLVNERESVEFAVWYYLDSWRSAVPQHLLDRYPPDEDDPDPEDSVAAMVFQADMDRVSNVIRSVKAAWSLAPEAVIREFGDLSRLPMREGDDIELWWPAALLTLAVREVDVVLSASADSHIPWDSTFDDLPEGGDHEARIEAFDPTTWTVSLKPPSLMAATRCALRAFRRVAEDTKKKPGSSAGGADDNGHPPAPVPKSQPPAGKSSEDVAKLAADTQEGTNRSPALIEVGTAAHGDDEAEEATGLVGVEAEDTLPSDDVEGQVESSNGKEVRRGRIGTKPDERFANVEAVYLHLKGEDELHSSEFNKLKKRIRNWLVGDGWNKPYQDTGKLWRHGLSEDRRIELCKMRSHLLSHFGWPG